LFRLKEKQMFELSFIFFLLYFFITLKMDVAQLWYLAPVPIIFNNYLNYL
jgi:hypothetical protein